MVRVSMCAYLPNPPLYSDAIARDSSSKRTDHSTVGGMYGGLLTCTSIKFSRTPRLHSRLLFLQFKQSGVPSSHFKCRSRHVRHPVLTRLGLLVATGVAAVGEDMSSAAAGALVAAATARAMDGRFLSPAAGLALILARISLLIAPGGGVLEWRPAAAAGAGLWTRDVLLLLLPSSIETLWRFGGDTSKPSFPPSGGVDCPPIRCCCDRERW